jgi:hypothetical protein
METAENPGAGYFLPGVWGCPPALKSPPRLGDIGGSSRPFQHSLLDIVHDLY